MLAGIPRLRPGSLTQWHSIDYSIKIIVYTLKIVITYYTFINAKNNIISVYLLHKLIPGSRLSQISTHF